MRPFPVEPAALVGYNKLAYQGVLPLNKAAQQFQIGQTEGVKRKDGLRPYV